MPKIRILLIEDNRILREGMIALINGYKDFKVIAVSNGREDTLAKARLSKPNVVLMDIGLPSKNILEVVAALKKDLKEIKIIIMGLIPTQSDIVEFVQNGADGFILKSATVEEVLTAVRSVAKGEKILPPTLTGSLFTHVLEHALKKRKGSITSAVQMSKREREIISSIADGQSNKQIAKNLNIATFTVKSHVHNILEKLALHPPCLY